jgi:hypothetical protein
MNEANREQAERCLELAGKELTAGAPLSLFCFSCEDDFFLKVVWFNKVWFIPSTPIWMASYRPQ